MEKIDLIKRIVPMTDWAKADAAVTSAKQIMDAYEEAMFFKLEDETTFLVVGIGNDLNEFHGLLDSIILKVSKDYCQGRFCFKLNENLVCKN